MKSYYNIHMLWLIMVVITLSSYTMGEFGHSGVVTVITLLLMALIKGSFIIRDFMELKGVSLLWRVIMYGWLLIICLAITVTYIIGVSQ